MKCPNCGKENTKNICSLCGTMIQRDSRRSFRFFSRFSKKNNIASLSNPCPVPPLPEKGLVNPSVDALFVQAGRIVIEKNRGSIGMLQRCLGIGFNRASGLMDELEKYGVVGPEEGTRPRNILMSISQFYSLIDEFNHNICISNSIDPVDFDSMEGHDFEYFCADLLRQNGFSSVTVTQGSGDHGIDILAEKDDITYAIQCKCYSSNIGNAAVQQAHTGKSLYKRDVAVVITNRYFTPQATEEAHHLGVKLWDRNKLKELIDKK